MYNKKNKKSEPIKIITKYENITCQNCHKILAKWNIDKSIFTINPSKINSISQELTKDTTLQTIQCPDCGCIVQIKI